MLLACDDMKQFGLIHQDFPKPYVSAGDTLQMPGGPRKTHRSGGTGLRRNRSEEDGGSIPGF